MELLSYSMVVNLYLKMDKICVCVCVCVYIYVYIKQSLSYLLSGVPNLKFPSIIDGV